MTCRSGELLRELAQELLALLALDELSGSSVNPKSFGLRPRRCVTVRLSACIMSGRRGGDRTSGRTCDGSAAGAGRAGDPKTNGPDSIRGEFIGDARGDARDGTSLRCKLEVGPVWLGSGFADDTGGARVGGSASRSGVGGCTKMELMWSVLIIISLRGTFLYQVDLHGLQGPLGRLASAPEAIRKVVFGRLARRQDRRGGGDRRVRHSVPDTLGVEAQPLVTAVGS